MRGPPSGRAQEGRRQPPNKINGPYNEVSASYGRFLGIVVLDAKIAKPRREQYVLPWYRVRLSRERARRLVRCYELGQASVLVFQIFMGV
jgi:hypothetical protein